MRQCQRNEAKQWAPKTARSLCGSLKGKLLKEKFPPEVQARRTWRGQLQAQAGALRLKPDINEIARD